MTQLPENIFMVRHGDYSRERGGSLTELGKMQAHQAAQKLNQEGFDSSSQILASTAIRALETAEIIRRNLILGPRVISSPRLEAMDHEDCNRDIREVLAEVIEDSGVDIDPDGTLAIVGHAPMIYRELEVDLSRLGEGSVHKMKI